MWLFLCNKKKEGQSKSAGRVEHFLAPYGGEVRRNIKKEWRMRKPGSKWVRLEMVPHHVKIQKQF